MGNSNARHRPFDLVRRNPCAPFRTIRAPYASPLQVDYSRVAVAHSFVLCVLDNRYSFGIVKSVMGFRQFLLRGLEKASGPVCLNA